MTEVALNSELEAIAAARRELHQRGVVPGRSGKAYPISETSLTLADGDFLRDMVRRSAAARTIETGFALGASGLAMLEGALATSQGASHLAVDPFQSADWDSAGVGLFERTGVSSRLSVVERDSALVLPALVEKGERFDFAYVDGSHLFEHAFLDVYYFHRLVRPGGLIVVDDIWMTPVVAAICFFITNLGSAYSQAPQGAPGARFGVLRTALKPIDRPWNKFALFWNLLSKRGPQAT